MGTKIREHYRRSTCGTPNANYAKTKSTKGLHMHIRAIHQIEVSKRKNANETNMELSK